jgi:tRNA1Val (adenine37-N6)-methyltransferase
MKVGTDGVLLGAWAGSGSPQRVLDIGTGTGLIALMMAQRFATAEITAIEPNDAAQTDAAQNFLLSPFSDRIQLFRGNFQDFQPLSAFDLIVSNPPFFTKSLVSQNAGREQARHANSLSIEDLSKAVEYLSENGSLAVIYPKEEFHRFRSLMADRGLFPHRTVAVKPTPAKAAHRFMGEFSRNGEVLEETELIIEENGRHQYSEEYKSLTKAFYL